MANSIQITPMTKDELDAAIDKAFDELLGVVSTKPGATLFDIAAQTDMKLQKLEKHWWTKLGKFLNVYGRN